MSPTQLLAYFDRIAEAPGAVPRLRRFIRELAVRGKLVEQNVEEQPRTLPSKRQPAHEGPFLLPDSWSWVSVRDVSAARLGKMLDKARNRGLPRRYLRNVNVRWFDFDLSSVFEMPFEKAELEEFSLRTGDVLVCEGGEPGRGAVWDERERDIYFQKAIHRVRFEKIVDPHFFVTTLRESFDSGRLATYYTGVGIKHLTGRGLASFSFPLAPLDEQHRIVAKVDELMALCDRLEAAQAERDRRRDRALLVAIRHAADSAGTNGRPLVFPRRITELVTRPVHVRAVQEAIRSLAVRGKLVNQEVSECADQHQLQVTALDLDGRPRGAQNRLPYFQVPPTWRWGSVDVVSQARLGKMLDRARNKGQPKRYLRNVNVRWFDFHLDDVLEMGFDETELEEFALRAGDVLVCEGGEPGRAAVWDGRETDIYFQKAIHRIRFDGSVDPHFFVMALRESVDSGRLASYYTGVTIKHLTGRGLASFTFPLPPIAEQRRIVATVDQLMRISRNLEGQVSRADSTSEQLLKAVLHIALDPSAQADEPVAGA